MGCETAKTAMSDLSAPAAYGHGEGEGGGGPKE